MKDESTKIEDRKSVVDAEVDEVSTVKQEIESGVDEMMTKREAKKTSDEEDPEKDAGKKPNLFDDEPEEGGGVVDDEAEMEVDDSKKDEHNLEQEGEPPAVSDAQIERAVRAGMSFADARKLDSTTLDRFTDMLEERSSGNADEKPSGNDADAEVEDELSTIPDLDPEDYDEKIVEGFKAMKEMIKKQSSVIKSLSSGKESDWFESKVSSLDVDIGNKKDALKSKFEALTAGYKAVGQDVSQDEVFGEASRIVIADEIAAAKEKSDRSDLKKRENLRVNRPTNHSQKAHKDPIDEVADEIDKKYFGKK